MKNYIMFIVKSVIIGNIIVQTTTADTGYNFVGNAIDEPIFLSLCGLALLYLGAYRSKTK